MKIWSRGSKKRVEKGDDRDSRFRLELDDGESSCIHSLTSTPSISVKRGSIHSTSYHRESLEHRTCSPDAEASWLVTTDSNQHHHRETSTNIAVVHTFQLP
jgi:hypothetical protein